MMTKLKTIKSTGASTFDATVNEYLANGWNIFKLTTAGTEKFSVLVAFLVKDEE